MDIGPQNAKGQSVQNPLPPSWLGLPTAPLHIPDSAKIFQLTSPQVRALQGQISYDASGWNYQLIGSDNQLGRYQYNTQTLENYGLLAAGSNAQYGTDCVNYLHCWKSTTIRGSNAFSAYTYNVTSLSAFLTSTATQDHLAYQIVYDLYNTLASLGAITQQDTADVVAGMIYVGWKLGAGSLPTNTNISGTGAYAWRFSGIGNGVAPYNSGRYAVATLSQ